MQKNYPLEGINRNAPQTIVDDFSCTELLNLRKETGTWRPAGNKKIAGKNPAGGEASKIFIHTTADTQQLIIYTTGKFMYSKFPDGETAYIFIDMEPIDKKYIRLNALGNILIIFFEPNGGLHPYTRYFIWKNTENNTPKYIELKELNPPNLEYALYGEKINQNLESQKGLGIIMAAYQTIDGQYIKQSAPILFNHSAKNTDAILYLFYKQLSEMIPVEWKDIIDNISIFTSAHENPQSPDDVTEYIAESNLYKIFEITDKEIKYQSTCLIADAGYGFIHDTDQGQAYNIYPQIRYREDNIPRGLQFTNQDSTYQYFNNDFMLDYYSAYPYFMIKKVSGIVNMRIKGEVTITIIMDPSQHDYDRLYADLRIKLVQISAQRAWVIEETTGIEFIDSNPVTIRYPIDYTVELPASTYTEDNYSFLISFFKTSPNTDVNFTVVIENMEISYSDPADNRGILKALQIPEKDVLLTKESLYSGDSPLPLNHNAFGSAEIVYNSRLFIGDVTTILHNGYSGYDYGGDGSSEGGYLYDPIEYLFVTHIRTDDGDKTVWSEWKYAYCYTFPNGSKYIFIKIPTIIAYPDYRAYKTEIFLRNRYGSTNNLATYKYKEYKLSPCKKNNFAFCYDHAFQDLLDVSTLTPTTFKLLNANNQWSQQATLQIPPDLVNAGLTEESLPQPSGIIRTQNNIAASALGIPMFFPLNKYYAAGEKKIIGFSTNAMSIDDSNFGLYPLFVFSQNGIYALEIGDGNTLINRISPLSGDVCINRESIANIGTASIFAADDGLRILQGQHSRKITQNLENQRTNPLATNRHFQAIVERHNLQGILSQQTFQTYIQQAKTYFNNVKKEIIVANEQYPYVYVISLPDNNGKVQISKRNEQFSAILYDHPKAYGVSHYDHFLYDLVNEQYPDEQRKIFIQTNAFKLDVDEFHHIRRIITRIAVTKSPLIGAYLFVSNDARQWAMTTGIENPAQTERPDTATFADFNYLACPESVKYAILIIAGNINMANDFLSHFSIEYDKRYHNKIR
jgi:phosphoribosylanthranilate isomerase